MENAMGPLDEVVGLTSIAMGSYASCLMDILKRTPILGYPKMEILSIMKALK